MASPGQLSTATSLNSSDQILFYSEVNGSTRKASLSTFLDWFEANYLDPNFQRVTASPTLAGFTFTLPSTANSLFSLLTPTGVMATGTIVLPPASVAADGQQIIVYSSQEITALSLTLNGATAINGAPTILYANTSFTIRFDKLSNAWFCIQGASASSQLISQGTFTPTFNGAGVVGDVSFLCKYQLTDEAVNLQLKVVTGNDSSWTWTTNINWFDGFPSILVPKDQFTTGSAVFDKWVFFVVKSGALFRMGFRNTSATIDPPFGQFFTIGANQTFGAQISYLI